MTTDALTNLISSASDDPGIYIFKEGGKKLYIGKAANLKSRLRSYLRTSDARIQKMLSIANRLELRTTGSDVEALILESQLIKKYRPKFNIMMRDDKQYGFVGFTRSTHSTKPRGGEPVESTSSGQAEKYPKIFITHQPNLKYRNIEISSFVGPFTDMGALKTTLRYLRRIFPYCTCRKSHNNFCLNYHIGKCPGFCCSRFALREAQLANRGSSISQPNSSGIWEKSGLKNAERTYRKNIKVIKDILSGKKTSLLKRLEKEMIKHGREEKFQEAVELRKKIEKIKRVFENASIIKNSKLEIKNLGAGNNRQTVIQKLKHLLNLNCLPIRIEGYDVANIQGEYAVGAMIVFTLQRGSGQANYKPDKNEYRRFKILNPKLETLNKFKTQNSKFKTGGDAAMLRQILIRRFRHPEWPFPDLVVVDGGKAQLSTASAVVNSKFKTLNPKQTQKNKNQNAKQIPIIALTKDKKHKGSKVFIAGKKNSISLSKLPADVKNLLLQIDSEAHRFAISYYRKLHRRTAVEAKSL